MTMKTVEPELRDTLVDQLRSAVGDEHVCSSPEDLDRYSRCTIPWQSRCAAVVFPNTTEEVAKIVAIARSNRIPLWPFSTGRNWGYGTTLATCDGAIVLILQRMNRILEVNEELAYAVIEPGVTYEQFNRHLRENGHRLWIDCIDGTAHGSVIGNALDRGVGATPYGDHFGNLCGMEVVLPDGEVIRTAGSSAGPATWNTHKWGLGPYLEGLFTQSNLGIVTKAGIWLMPQPEHFNSYVFQVSSEKHLPAVLDALRRLALAGVVNTKVHVINDFVSLTLITQRRHESVSTNGALSETELEQLGRKYRISPWTCAGGIYGTRAQVRLQRSLLRRALRRHGKLTFVSDAALPFIERIVRWSERNESLRRVTERVAGTSLAVLRSAPYVHRLQQGIPTEFFVRHAYFRNARNRPDRDVDPARDRCGLIWFAPILPYSNEHLQPYLQACRTRFREFGFDFYVAMLLMNPRSMICLMSVLYDRDEPEEASRAQQLYETLLCDMLERGYQQYRAGLSSWNTVFLGAPGLEQLAHRIKAAVDPDRILAPGHYGVR